MFWETPGLKSKSVFDKFKHGIEQLLNCSDHAVDDICNHMIFMQCFRQPSTISVARTGLYST